MYFAAPPGAAFLNEEALTLNAAPTGLSYECGRLLSYVLGLQYLSCALGVELACRDSLIPYSGK